FAGENRSGQACREPAYWTSTWATEDTALRRFAAPRSMSVVPGATTDRRVRFRRRYSNLDDAMADTVSPALSAFYFFADTPRRRAALHAEPGSAERYVLYGLDQERLRGVSVAHNLERGAPPPWARLADRASNGGDRKLRGTGGEVAPAVACPRQVDR